MAPAVVLRPFAVIPHISGTNALRQFVGFFKRRHRLIAKVADMHNRLNSKPHILAFG